MLLPFSTALPINFRIILLASLAIKITVACSVFKTALRVFKRCPNSAPFNSNLSSGQVYFLAGSYFQLILLRLLFLFSHNFGFKICVKVILVTQGFIFYNQNNVKKYCS
jgi:hypothetical protein